MVDRRKNQLQFRVNLIEMNKKPLLADFRLCKVSAFVFICFIMCFIICLLFLYDPRESILETKQKGFSCHKNFMNPS